MQQEKGRHKIYNKKKIGITMGHVENSYNQGLIFTVLNFEIVGNLQILHFEIKSRWLITLTMASSHENLQPNFNRRLCLNVDRVQKRLNLLH